MKNNFDDKMADIIIGEAVTALLDDNVAISWAALNDRLQAMLDCETDSDRIRAVLRVIEDVRREMEMSAVKKEAFTAGHFSFSGKLH
ncbi:hypothetical protein [Pantoea dispersa]|uniref:Uncharacterized protein n=1 Tax=Pantoea dispersa TaxID=59814 RepID=A0A8E1RXY4_9GAMM|nr:hypothetical protein [Pantoea dispersa]KTR91777.1 hypothetical protein SA2_04475 [Pantoea dispersa]KTS21978.1 hypothetical protein SA4R_12715 [Pantoea dispersa]KTS61885.1 hypothetical protein SA5R_07625 [Pantoea dispersa]KTS67352.1 hypothetical protein SA3R_11745 [Pantoea dispersa]